MANPHPTIGRIVKYRSETGNYDVPAVITMTQESAYQPGILAGHVPPLTGRQNVHLHVMTPGAQVEYQEHDVPPSVDPVHPEPRTWRWPERI